LFYRMADAGTFVEDRPRLVETRRSPARIAIAAGLGVFATLGLIVLAWAVRWGTADAAAPVSG